MKNTQLCNVVMLPTNEASPLYLHDKEGLGFSVTGKYLKTNCIQPQHLYLVSDEEIKEGDWFFSSYYKTVQQSRGHKGLDTFGEMFQKIIATTDKSLISEESRTRGFQNIGQSIRLPQPPESFIKAFVEAQGKITEVLVEYEDKNIISCKGELHYSHGTEESTEEHPENVFKCSVCGNEVTNPSFNWGKVRTCGKQTIIQPKLKLREDNTVIIHEARKYSYDDLVKVFYYAQEQTQDTCDKSFTFDHDITHLSSFIEQNL